MCELMYMYITLRQYKPSDTHPKAENSDLPQVGSEPYTTHCGPLTADTRPSDHWLSSDWGEELSLPWATSSL